MELLRTIRVQMESVYAWCFEFEASKQCEIEADYEFLKIQDLKRHEPNAKISVIYDTGVSPSGLGDWALEIISTFFLKSLGFEVSLTLVDSGIRGPGWEFLTESAANLRVLEFKELASNIIGDEFQFSFKNSLEASRKGHLFFQDNYEEKKDHNINLFRFLDKATVLNQNWTESLPFLPKERADSKIMNIGVGIRNAPNQRDRNPDMNKVAKDLDCLLSQFPEATFTLFSNSESLDQVEDFLSKKRQAILPRIRRQSATSYTGAFLEALGTDVWFQRDGGGMGMAATFSRRPYIFVSHHTIGSRMFGFKQPKYGIWSRTNQIYILSPFKFLTHRRAIQRACEIIKAHL